MDKSDLNKLDCTFYFVVRDDNPHLIPPENVRSKICDKFATIVDVQFYGMRSGPGVRSAKVLKEEWSDTIPEQVNIIVIDKDKDSVILLSHPRRNRFFEKVMQSTEDIDTVDIADDVMKEIPEGDEV